MLLDQMRSALRVVLFLVAALFFSEVMHGADTWGTVDYGAMTCSGYPETKCGGGNSAWLDSGQSHFTGQCSKEELTRPLVVKYVKTANSNSISPARVRIIQNESIHPVTLETKPAWSNSAAWGSDGKSILIADTVNKKLLQFSFEGHLLPSRNPINGFLSLIQGTDWGYLVEGADGDFIWLDRTLAQQRSLNLKAESFDGSTKITSVFGWTLAGDRLLTFGDLEKVEDSQGTHSPLTSLLKLDAHKPLNIDPILQVGKNARRFFTTGYPLLAGLGNNGYMLVLENDAKVVELGFGLRELATFPPEYRSVPNLPDPPKSAAELFGPIEKAKTAIGLLGWKDTLYLITRKPLSDQSTEWTIWAIDPRTDQLLEGVILPTQKAHILVLPGPKYWAIVEKGAVGSDDRQEISSLLLVESEAIEAAHEGKAVTTRVEAP